jgi:hypothetical protein
MNQRTKLILFWAPRVLGILFAGFTGIFALDVFDAHQDMFTTLLALLIHLIPTAVIVIALLISWKWEWIGGVLFLAMAIFYIGWAWGRFPLSVYFIIAGPLTLVAVLFIINWKYRTQVRSRP